MSENNKKVFTSINDLLDLSKIPEGKKKRIMARNAENLSKYLALYRQAWSDFNKAKDAYAKAPAITDVATYRVKKELARAVGDAENLVVRTRSSLSYYINSLLYDHNCASDRHNKLNVDELYKIVNAYEQKEFTDNHFPKRRLRKICKNNIALKNFEFELEVAKAISNGSFRASRVISKNKDSSWWKKQIGIIEKKIVSCQDRKGSLDDTYRSMQYAKLIKKFDKQSQKKVRKTEKVEGIESEYVIDFKDITKYYYNKWMATKVLKGFDLKIKKGEFVVILGPSGSGKTTLLNIMSGMDNATYGQTIVNGYNLIKMSDTQLTNFRRDNIGYIFQQYGLLPNLNVKENVEIGWNLQSDKSKRLDIDELLKTVSMSEHAKKFPHELSGGQQQRVSVARSMAKNPAIVFGDEPTGAVDEEMSKQILQLFVDINKKFNTTVIIVTHNPIFADLATRVIKVNSGTIAANYENTNRKSVSELDWSSNH